MESLSDAALQVSKNVKNNSNKVNLQKIIYSLPRLFVDNQTAAKLMLAFPFCLFICHHLSVRE